MVHIQDLIENSDPCLITISKQCSFTSDPSTLVESSIHPDMRIQCNPLPLFLLGLVVTSMVEASGGKRHKRKGKKVKGKHPPPSILLDDTSIAESEVLVSQVPKTFDSSSLHSLDSSSMERNEILPSLFSHVSTTSDFSFFNPSFGTES